jgi:glycosyltransferase involved in cell wall biosynthesis
MAGEMKDRGRIFYVLADYPHPSGGTRRMYRHVHQLNRLGFDAVMVHQKRPFKSTWHGYDVPVTWLSEHPVLGARDVVVCTESTPSLLRHLKDADCQRVVCALAWSPGYVKLNPGESWGDYGVKEVITPSPVIAEYVRWTMGLEVTIIGEYVDPGLYSHQPGEKSDSIAYMPRKDPAGDILRGVYSARGAPFDRYAWVACNALAQADYARALRAARIYLPPSTMEGANVSVLEAMACGCLVVGYHGGGGRAFMRGGGPGQNCVLVENGDLPAFGPALEAVLRALARDPDAYAPVIASALATARPYQDEGLEARSLATFYSRLLDQARPAGQGSASTRRTQPNPS